jgi:hypothetical protein
VKIKKDSTNPHFKSKYASLSVILDEIQPILTKHNLAYTQIPEAGKLITLLMHTGSGEWIESDYDLNSIQNTPQAMGSAITYARRYSLTAALGLNIDDDDDGNAASEPKKQTQQQPKQQQGATNPPQQQPAPAPITPFTKVYGDAEAIAAVLEICKTKQEMLDLYANNKNLVDKDAALKAGFKKKDSQFATGGKVIITDSQFTAVCARMENGELSVYENAVAVYLLNDKQATYLKELYTHIAGVETAIKLKAQSADELLTIIAACTNSRQVLTLHQNNAFIADRDAAVSAAINNKLRALKQAA